MASKKPEPSNTLNFRLNVGTLDKQRLKRLKDHMQYMQDHYSYIKPRANYAIKKDEFDRIILKTNHDMLECMVQELLFDPCKSEITLYMRKVLREQGDDDFSDMPSDFLKKV